MPTSLSLGRGAVGLLGPNWRAKAPCAACWPRRCPRRRGGSSSPGTRWPKLSSARPAWSCWRILHRPRPRAARLSLRAVHPGLGGERHGYVRRPQTEDVAALCDRLEGPLFARCPAQWRV